MLPVRYQDLIKSVNVIVVNGLLSARKALEYERVKTYWRVGKKINDYIKRTPGAARRGEAFLEQFSIDLRENTDLDLSHDTVVRAVQFNREYSVFPENTPLTFTHYLALLRVHDVNKRIRLEKRAVKSQWKSPRLKEEVSQYLFNIKQDASLLASVRPFEIKMGEPFLYCTQRKKDVSGRDILSIDCGFKMCTGIPPGNEHIKSGNRVVRVRKRGRKYVLKTCQKARARRYTYPARIIKVVDADTMDARVDIGFGMWIYDRFRLRGINASEMNTDEGRHARAFVARMLKRSPDVVIRTFKEGVYGRWIADMFVLKNERDPYLIAAQGDCLNHVLLTKGLAEQYKK